LLISIPQLEKCVSFPLHLQAIVIGRILRRRGNFFSKRLKNIEDRNKKKNLNEIQVFVVSLLQIYKNIAVNPHHIANENTKISTH